MEIVHDEPPSVERIRERRERLEARLRAAAEANGQDPDCLRIVAVTKAWPIEVARGALEAGCKLLGESRVQEAEPKVAAVPEAEWHFVGRLQSNKARRAVRAFAVIHSVDSFELLSRIAELATEESTAPRVLLQVNVTGEAAKAGISPGALLTPDGLAAVRGAKPAGLMTIARMGASTDEARATFRGLRELRDRLQEATGTHLPELSMGMTADVDAAAAEGATLVRLGTALFGPRP
ncbi:MAG TPA: YggS family pyridoxal phosphate-dependent enzyme [Methylomirabilota bacterium]|nr:YggS family pyridoxal phosphate-dependent enzyme [Methylomirabilota bacterium]